MKLTDKYIDDIIKAHESIQRTMANRISELEKTVSELMEEVEQLEKQIEEHWYQGGN
jgi:cell division septum initiation protein DivIVA